MTYTPSDSEKQTTAVAQLLAGVLLFIPPLVVWRTQFAKRSPYVRYWAKVCLVWSSLMTIAIAGGSAATVILESPNPAIFLAVVHFVVCMTGAISSYFNTPFRYWFIANKFCELELGNVYGRLIARPRNGGE